MKSFNIFITALLVFHALQGQETVQKSDRSSYGEYFNPDKVLSEEAMLDEYENFKVGDSLPTVFEAKVDEVCQAKGCWMRLRLDDENEVLVKFKDYGFFVPTDVAGDLAIVKGKAFVEELSVEEQRHYARDSGAKETEVLKITQPKRTLRFEATGVIIED